MSEKVWVAWAREMVRLQALAVLAVLLLALAVLAVLLLALAVLLLALAQMCQSQLP